MQLMKYGIICILIVTISACRQETEKPKIESSIQLDSSVTHLVEQFIAEEHCEGTLNDITIDKILPDSTIITVRTMTAYRRYFIQHPKRRKVVVKGVPFYYYDGSEEFLESIPIDTNEVCFNVEHMGDAAWTYVKSQGGIKIYKDGGEPFFYPTFYIPKPKFEFLPPE
ncbi:hypothetical protein [Dyadobacter fermentans]|uniref:Lipoprotein n=1 Tax=Dyadobacter fermentans (strain ATCC 700827 / DSM 18053 / CIP 107007 / KCTC 52180 / NS114) TaxID=471854 RepID=C6W0T8_DYAFD|nr:hypothetical protein [Dyadobacter fermentans]ACT95393.1 hypothetical protein Dfer_4190 [Dyadobacter fermentans DSM 18053]